MTGIEIVADAGETFIDPPNELAWLYREYLLLAQTALRAAGEGRSVRDAVAQRLIEFCDEACTQDWWITYDPAPIEGAVGLGWLHRGIVEGLAPNGLFEGQQPADVDGEWVTGVKGDDGELLIGVATGKQTLLELTMERLAHHTSIDPEE
jgi:hypothetical protein